MRFLNKPEYFFNPPQLVRRLKAFGREESPSRKLKTVWGAAITVNESETIGRSISHFGVYDLVLTECLWRLAGPGQVALDIGANIGYFSLLLAKKMGPSGKIYSFEPHPSIFNKLSNNLKDFSSCHLKNEALSDKKGEMKLFVPKDFSGNEGTATFERNQLKNGSVSEIPVNVEVLDEVIGDNKIDLIKIDVEGHEASVFKGAERVLKRTTHVFLEDFLHDKSPAIKALKDLGFDVFRIKKTFFGPMLVSPQEGLNIPLWEPPNYLATRDRESVLKALKPRGWQCLL